MSKKTQIVIFSVIILIVGIGFFYAVGKDTGVLLKQTVLNSEYVSLVGDNLLVSNGKKFGYYDLDGNKKIDLKYSFEQESYSRSLDSKDDLFVITENNVLYGVINSKGKEIIPKEYIAIRIISSKCFLVQSEDLLWSVIDNNNKVIIDNKYKNFDIIKNKGAILYNDEQYEIIDIEGKKLSNSKYVYVVSYNDGDVLVGQYGTGVNDLYIYTKNKYKAITGVGDMISVKDGEVFYPVDGGTFDSYNIETGKVGHEANVDFSVNDMFINVNEEGLVGFRSSDETKVIENKYDVDGTFGFNEDGVAVVSLKGKMGVIDTNGKEVIPCKYKHVVAYSDKLFEVSEDLEKYYLVDSSNKKLGERLKATDNYVSYSKGDKCGVLNKYGKTIFTSKYLDCQVYDNLVIVEDKDNNWIIKY